MFTEGKSPSINTSLLLIDLHQRVALTYPTQTLDDSRPSLRAPTGSEMFRSKLLITRKFATSSFLMFQARQTTQQKKQAAEESRKEYVTSLNQFNQDQHQHYHTLVPVIYQVQHLCSTLLPVTKLVTKHGGCVFPVSVAYPGHGGAAHRESWRGDASVGRSREESSSGSESLSGRHDGCRREHSAKDGEF